MHSHRVIKVARELAQHLDTDTILMLAILLESLCENPFLVSDTLASVETEIDRQPADALTISL